MKNTTRTKLVIFIMIVFCSLFCLSNTLFANGLILILNPSNNHYYAETEMMSWSDAETLANDYGGHLVTINSQEEQDWLISAFDPEKNYWIGFNDIDQEGVWVWSSGENPIYDNWCLGEPNDCCDDENGREENAAVMNSALLGCPNGGWNDLPDWHHHYAIIEVSDCEADPCGGLIRTSEYCKCLSKFNSECCDVETDEDCLYPWDGVLYTEFSACMKGLLPFDRVFFGPGDNCVAAVCKFFVQWGEDTFTYKNLGQCMKDKASEYLLYGEPWEFQGECGFDNWETWVESCECVKASIYGD